jgi:hypothetical protein
MARRLNEIQYICKDFGNAKYIFNLRDYGLYTTPF